MKCVVAGVFAFFLLLGSSLGVRAQELYVVDLLDSRVIVNRDTSFNVVETMTITSSGPSRASRMLPTVYRAAGQLLRPEVTVSSLVDVDGNPVAYTTESVGDGLRVWWDVPDGQLTYTLSYMVRYGLVKGQTHTFYWNVTGVNWPVPVSKARIVLFSQWARVLQASCLAGEVGRGIAVCAQEAQDATQARFSATDLGKGREMVVTVGLDSFGQLVWPTATQIPTQADQEEQVPVVGVVRSVSTKLFLLVGLGVFAVGILLIWVKSKGK